MLNTFLVQADSLVRHIHPSGRLPIPILPSRLFVKVVHPARLRKARTSDTCKIVLVSGTGYFQIRLSNCSVDTQNTDGIQFSFGSHIETEKDDRED